MARTSFPRNADRAASSVLLADLGLDSGTLEYVLAPLIPGDDFRHQSAVGNARYRALEGDGVLDCHRSGKPSPHLAQLAGVAQVSDRCFDRPRHGAHSVEDGASQSSDLGDLGVKVNRIEVPRRGRVIDRAIPVALAHVRQYVSHGK